MKKFLTISLIILVTFIYADARQPSRGYRGFIEWSNDLRTERFSGYSSREAMYYTGVTTSHGYQINPMFFAGAGVGLERCGKYSGWVAPLFAEGRADFRFGRFTPFADLRLGLNLAEGMGVYFSPSIGYRINWGRKVGINIGLGMSLAGYKVDLYYVDYGPNGYLTMTQIGSERRVRPYFSFRLGFDF